MADENTNKDNAYYKLEERVVQDELALRENEVTI